MSGWCPTCPQRECAFFLPFLAFFPARSGAHFSLMYGMPFGTWKERGKLIKINY